MRNGEKFKENKEVVVKKETGVQKGDEEGKYEVKVLFAGSSLPFKTCKKSSSNKFYLSASNEQQDLEVIDNEHGEETRDHENYFDPSPGWKLWKSWDVWDKIGESEETVDDESDMDATSPGWKLWKNWDIWDVWKNTQSIPKE